MSRSNEDPENKIEIACMAMGIENEKEIVVSGAGKAPTNVELIISKPENSVLHKDGSLTNRDGMNVTEKKYNYENVVANRKARETIQSKGAER